MPLGQIDGKIKVHRTQDLSRETVRMKRAEFAEELARQGQQQAQQRDAGGGREKAAPDGAEQEPDVGPQTEDSTFDVRI